MILRELVVGPFASNCFILGSEATKKGMIIDPGADADNIMDTVNDLDLSIVLVVVTHNHIDHIGALRQIKESTGAIFAVHEADARGMDSAGSGGMLGSIMGRSFKAPPSPDRLLHDGDVLEVGDLKFTVLHTPGHTPGGISILCDSIVFSGDTLFNFGIGRTDMQGGNYKTLINSIVNKLMVLPDATVVYPGHGPRTTIGAERKGNPFLSSDFQQY